MTAPTFADLVDEAAIAQLRADPCFSDRLLHILLILQANQVDPTPLRAQLAPWQQSDFDVWHRRRQLTLAPVTLEAFCVLATERARLRDPEHPALTAEGLEVVTRWYAGWQRRAVQPGWVLDEEDRDEGPAEAIHVDEWKATATLSDRTLVLGVEHTPGRLRVWEEEL